MKMLGKLLKYDLLSSTRYLVLCYVIDLVLSALFAVSLILPAPDAAGTSALTAGELIRTAAVTTMGGIWLFGMCGLVLLTYILIIRRFYTNMVSDEGYLTLTLPVSVRMHMLSKLICGLLWLIMTFAVIFLGILIVMSMARVRNFWSRYGYLLRLFAGSILYYKGAVFYVNTFLGFVRGILLIFFSICVGQLCRKRKIWGAIGTYLGLTVVLRFTVGAAAFLGVILGTRAVQNWIAGPGGAGVRCLYLCAQILVFFFCGARILEKRANLA